MLSTNTAKILLAGKLLFELFTFSAIYGTMLYFTFKLFSIDITYEKSFLVVVLLRSLFMGIVFQVNKEKINENFERSVKEFNNKKAKSQN